MTESQEPAEPDLLHLPEKPGRRYNLRNRDTAAPSTPLRPEKLPPGADRVLRSARRAPAPVRLAAGADTEGNQGTPSRATSARVSRPTSSMSVTHKQRPPVSRALAAPTDGADGEVEDKLVDGNVQELAPAPPVSTASSHERTRHIAMRHDPMPVKEALGLEDGDRDDGEVALAAAPRQPTKSAFTGRGRRALSGSTAAHTAENAKVDREDAIAEAVAPPRVLRRRRGGLNGQSSKSAAEPAVRAARRVSTRRKSRPASATGSSVVSGGPASATRGRQALSTEHSPAASAIAVPFTSNDNVQASRSQTPVSGSESMTEGAKTPENMHLWRKADLVVECKRRNLSTSGTKNELRARIAEDVEKERKMLVERNREVQMADEETMKYVAHENEGHKEGDGADHPGEKVPAVSAMRSERLEFALGAEAGIRDKGDGNEAEIEKSQEIDGGVVETRDKGDGNEAEIEKSQEIDGGVAETLCRDPMLVFTQVAGGMEGQRPGTLEESRPYTSEAPLREECTSVEGDAVPRTSTGPEASPAYLETGHVNSVNDLLRSSERVVSREAKNKIQEKAVGNGEEPALAASTAASDRKLSAPGQETGVVGQPQAYPTLDRLQKESCTVSEARHCPVARSEPDAVEKSPKRNAGVKGCRISERVDVVEPGSDVRHGGTHCDELKSAGRRIQYVGATKNQGPEAGYASLELMLHTARQDRSPRGSSRHQPEGLKDVGKTAEDGRKALGTVDGGHRMEDRSRQQERHDEPLGLLDPSGAREASGEPPIQDIPQRSGPGQQNEFAAALTDTGRAEYSVSCEKKLVAHKSTNGAEDGQGKVLSDTKLCESDLASPGNSRMLTRTDGPRVPSEEREDAVARRPSVLELSSEAREPEHEATCPAVGLLQSTEARPEGAEGGIAHDLGRRTLCLEQGIITGVAEPTNNVAGTEATEQPSPLHGERPSQEDAVPMARESSTDVAFDNTEDGTLGDVEQALVPQTVHSKADLSSGSVGRDASLKTAGSKTPLVVSTADTSSGKVGSAPFSESPLPSPIPFESDSEKPVAIDNTMDIGQSVSILREESQTKQTSTLCEQGESVPDDRNDFTESPLPDPVPESSSTHGHPRGVADDRGAFADSPLAEAVMEQEDTRDGAEVADVEAADDCPDRANGNIAKNLQTESVPVGELNGGDSESSEQAGSGPVVDGAQGVQQRSSSMDERSSDDDEEAGAGEEGSGDNGDPADEIVANLVLSSMAEEDGHSPGDSRSSQGSDPIPGRVDSDQLSPGGSWSASDSSPRSGGSSRDRDEDEDNADAEYANVGVSGHKTTADEVVSISSDGSRARSPPGPDGISNGAGEADEGKQAEGKGYLISEAGVDIEAKAQGDMEFRTERARTRRDERDEVEMSSADGEEVLRKDKNGSNREDATRMDGKSSERHLQAKDESNELKQGETGCLKSTARRQDPLEFHKHAPERFEVSSSRGMIDQNQSVCLQTSKRQSVVPIVHTSEVVGSAVDSPQDVLGPSDALVSPSKQLRVTDEPAAVLFGTHVALSKLRRDAAGSVLKIDRLDQTTGKSYHVDGNMQQKRPLAALMRTSSQTSAPQGDLLAPPPSPCLPNLASTQGMPPPRRSLLPRTGVASGFGSHMRDVATQTEEYQPLKRKRPQAVEVFELPNEKKVSLESQDEKKNNMSSRPTETFRRSTCDEPPMKRHKGGPALFERKVMPTPAMTLSSLRPVFSFRKPMRENDCDINRSLDFGDDTPERPLSILQRLSRIENQETQRRFGAFRDTIGDRLEEVRHHADQHIPNDLFHMGSITTGRRIASQPLSRRKAIVRVMRSRKAWDSSRLAAQSLRRAQDVARKVGAWQTLPSPFDVGGADRESEAQFDKRGRTEIRFYSGPGTNSGSKKRRR